MRLSFGYCVTFKLIRTAAFEHLQDGLQCTFVCWSGGVHKRHQLEVRFKVTELLKQSDGRLQALTIFIWNASHCLNHALSTAVTAELTGSEATGCVLKACLSFSPTSQTSPIPRRDLHTTIKLSICQSNGEGGTQGCPLNGSLSGYCILLYINIK